MKGILKKTNFLNKGEKELLQYDILKILHEGKERYLEWTTFLQ